MMEGGKEEKGGRLRIGMRDRECFWRSNICQRTIKIADLNLRAIELRDRPTGIFLPNFRCRSVLNLEKG
jgi:hypothetical protein